MLTQKVSTIDELLQFVSTLRQKHGVRLWFRGEERGSDSDPFHPAKPEKTGDKFHKRLHYQAILP